MASDHKEIEALVQLLDDTDDEIIDHVKKKLLSLGEEVVPVLEDMYIRSNQTVRARLDILIYQLQNENLLTRLLAWAESGGSDLFEGVFNVTRIGYPNLDKAELLNRFDKIKLDAWLQLHNTENPMSQVRILNQVIFEKYQFKGDKDTIRDADNSFVNRVFDRKSGNPLSLGLIYSIVAQRLNIPVFGVNLPHHFVLCYKELINKPDTDRPLNEHEFLNPLDDGEVLFYINAYNEGSLFNRWNIEQFLKQLKLDVKADYFEPCTNVVIIIRLLNNLIQAYEKEQNHTKIKYLNSIIAQLQPYAE